MSFQSLEKQELPRRRRAKVSLFAQGEPMIWLTGGGLAVALCMIAGLLALIFANGIATLWPVPVQQFQTLDGKVYMGEVTRAETFRSNEEQIRTLHRRLVRTGNYEISGEHFTWISDHEVKAETRPEQALVIERTAWGRFYGLPESFSLGGETVASAPGTALEKFNEYHGAVSDRRAKIRELETKDVGLVNRRLEKARLDLRTVELRDGTGSPAWQAEHEKFVATEKAVTAEFTVLQEEIARLRAENSRYVLNLKTAQGKDVAMPLEAIVRAYPANQLSILGKARIYFSRWGEFLFDEPREANSEGGVFPAIFGTVIMTLLMSLAVVPFGVMSALYLREYAKPGLIVSAVRISINNLAGVPSIVFGVFGLTFSAKAHTSTLTGQRMTMETLVSEPSAAFSTATVSPALCDPAETTLTTVSFPSRSKGTITLCFTQPSSTSPIQSAARTRSPTFTRGMKSQDASMSRGAVY
jgi:phosphate transport system permease protein